MPCDGCDVDIVVFLRFLDQHLADCGFRVQAAAMEYHDLVGVDRHDHIAAHILIESVQMSQQDVGLFVFSDVRGYFGQVEVGQYALAQCVYLVEYESVYGISLDVQ